MGTRWTRSWVAGLLALGITGAAVAPGAAAAGGAGEPPEVEVVVDGDSVDQATAAVLAAGGSVGTSLELIGAVTATVPSSAVTGLRRSGLEVVENRSVRPVDHQFATDAGHDVNAQVTALNPGRAGGPDAGAGIGVGLIDTGVDPHPDLPTLRAGVDLSAGGVGGGRPPAGALVDGYGHGTFIAGLIAGRRTGVAPGAGIVSIKVAGDDGTTDLGTLIAAIGWAVAHQDSHEIDVLNLSFGVETRMAAPGDPMVQAVEAAWASGLTVVVASGNEGRGTVTSPGTSPSALTIGATDHKGTADLADDVLAPWSGSTAGRTPKPELVVPGTSLISLRAEGSEVDRANPDSFIPGDDGPGYFVGSGTSMAAGLASGAAATVLARHPGAAPGDVKSALVDTARPAAGGHTIDLDAAVFTEALGSGGAAGADQPRRGVGPGRARQDTVGWAGARWAGARWTDAGWAGARWTEAEWAGARWTGARWTGARWTGARWTMVELG